MLIEVDTVKGFRDILPPDSLKRRAVKKIIEEKFASYGFLPIETPVIELDELMRPDVLHEEDEAVSDRFRLKDRGGRNLGLRYEFTFQLARLFKLNPNIKLPFKRYQIGEVFRDEPVGPGRFRQFTQCDVDIVGDGSIEADVELLALTQEVFNALNIDIIIQVNNRKLITALIESVQITDKVSVMKELDKLDKIGEDHVKSNLRKYADANQILTLFKLLEKDRTFFKSNAFDGAAEFDELEKKCRLYGIKVQLSPTMMRGLGYYTGNIFEIRTKDKGYSLGGGGRYDKVVGKYLQKEIPAAGISFGLDRVVEAAQISIQPAISALIISLNKESHMIKLAKQLRDSQISCITTTNKPGKALEYANSLNIPYVIFIGDDEVEKKKFKLKNMKSGEERLLAEKSLISALKKSSIQTTE